MKIRLFVLVVVASVPAVAASTTAVSASAFGCFQTGTFSASCSGIDGSSSSAFASLFPFGIHTVLDAQGAPTYTGPVGGSASAKASLELSSLLLAGTTGPAWVFPSVQRSVDTWSSGNMFTGTANFLGYLATPQPIQVTVGVPFTIALGVNAYVFADGGVRSHLDGMIWIDKLTVFLQPPGTPGLQKLNGTGGLAINLNPMVLEVYDTVVADVATPEPAAFFLLAPALVGLLLYRSR